MQYILYVQSISTEQIGERDVGRNKMKTQNLKNAFDYGYAYAEAMQGEDGHDGPVDINDMLTSICEIPSDDYTMMIRAGIDTNSREYWRGFNSFFSK